MTFIRFLFRAIRDVRNHELEVLLAFFIVVVGSWGFMELADDVLEGDTQAFDEWAIRSLRQPHDPSIPVGPPWMHEAGRDITALGGTTVLGVMVAVVVIYLLIMRTYGAAVLVLVATIGGALLSGLLKDVIDRTRPDIVPHLSIVSSPSFPSGHSMLSAVVYMTLGTLLARLQTSRRVKAYFIGWALFISFLVGLSRVYLGVHYPSDVLAGWTAGLVWAMLCWLGARSLQRRGKVEHVAVGPAPDPNGEAHPGDSSPAALPDSPRDAGSSPTAAAPPSESSSGLTGRHRL